MSTSHESATANYQVMLDGAAGRRDRRLSSHLCGRRARNRSYERCSWTDLVSASVFYCTTHNTKCHQICTLLR